MFDVLTRANSPAASNVEGLTRASSMLTQTALSGRPSVTANVRPANIPLFPAHQYPASSVSQVSSPQTWPRTAVSSM